MNAGAHLHSPGTVGGRLPTLISRWCAVLIGMGLSLAVTHIAPGQNPLSASRRSHQIYLEWITASGGVWVASNAAYAKPGSGEPESYGLIRTMLPGGAAAVGCLFSADLGRFASFWWFLEAWDPRSDSVLVYQVAPNGMVGVGAVGPLVGGVSEMLQVFATPGEPGRPDRHLITRVHEDTMRTEGFRRDGETWKPTRVYTWVRQPSDGRFACPRV